MYTAEAEQAFSRKTMRELAHGNPPTALAGPLASHLTKEGCSTLEEGFSYLYEYLFKQHRSEYTYKSTLLNKIVFGRHSPRTSTAFEELPIGGSIADFVVINGKATVYEVKTELDTLQRLDAQIADYYSAFDTVIVVCGPRNTSEVMERCAESPLGVLQLTDRERLSMKKEPEEIRSHLSHRAMFDVLRTTEREDVLKMMGIEPPRTTPVRRYAEYLALFESLSLEEVYGPYLAVLKRRGTHINGATVSTFPKELRVPGYFSGLSQGSLEVAREQLSLPLAELGG